MAVEKQARHVGIHTAPRWLRTSIIVLVLIGAVLLTISAGKESVPSLHALATPAVPSVQASERGATATSDQRLTTQAFFARDMNDKISVPVATPRECQPELGIVTECTFN